MTNYDKLLKASYKAENMPCLMGSRVTIEVIPSILIKLIEENLIMREALRSVAHQNCYSPSECQDKMIWECSSCCAGRALSRINKVGG